MGDVLFVWLDFPHAEAAEYEGQLGLHEDQGTQVLLLVLQESLRSVRWLDSIKVATRDDESDPLSRGRVVYASAGVGGRKGG